MYPGTDPGALWRNREWRKLLNLIERLPFDSQLKEAQLNDPEYVASLEEARKRAETEGKRVREGHPVSEASAEVRELRRMRQEIQALRNVVLTFAGGKASPIKPEPLLMAGTNSADEARERQIKHERLAARLLPKKNRDGREGPTVVDPQ